LGFSDGKRFGIRDLRSKSTKYGCEMPMRLLSIDFNPIKVNTLATAGEDSTIRFWDLRKLDTGLCLHSYNPTDTFVNFDSSPSTDQKFSDLNRASISGIHGNLMQKF
jgi:WD40 repeat protein